MAGHDTCNQLKLCIYANPIARASIDRCIEQIHATKKGMPQIQNHDLLPGGLHLSRDSP